MMDFTRPGHSIILALVISWMCSGSYRMDKPLLVFCVVFLWSISAIFTSPTDVLAAKPNPAPLSFCQEYVPLIGSSYHNRWEIRKLRRQNEKRIWRLSKHLLQGELRLIKRQIQHYTPLALRSRLPVIGGYTLSLFGLGSMVIGVGMMVYSLAGNGSNTIDIDRVLLAGALVTGSGMLTASLGVAALRVQRDARKLTLPARQLSCYRYLQIKIQTLLRLRKRYRNNRFRNPRRDPAPRQLRSKRLHLPPSQMQGSLRLQVSL